MGEKTILKEGFTTVWGTLSGYKDYIKEPISVGEKEEIKETVLEQMNRVKS